MTLVGSAALGHRVDQRERETLSITLSHSLFLLLALLISPFLLGEKEIWRPSFQFWGDNEISQKLIMKIERNRNFVYRDQQRKRFNIIQIQKFPFQNLSRPLSGYMSTQKLTWAGFCHVQNQTWKKPVCPRRGISHILSLVLLKSCWNAIKIIWEKSISAKMWSILERSLI